MKPFLIVTSLMAVVVGAGVYFTAPCGPCCEAPVQSAPAAAAVEAAPASAAPRAVSTSEAQVESPSACSPCFPNQPVDLERMISAEQEGECGAASECGSQAASETADSDAVASEAVASQAGKVGAASSEADEVCDTAECPLEECLPTKAPAKTASAQN